MHGIFKVVRILITVVNVIGIREMVVATPNVVTYPMAGFIVDFCYEVVLLYYNNY